MTDLTLMTPVDDPATVLPSLALLSHRVRVLPLDAASLVKMPEDTILFIDARDDLASAKTICRMVHATGLTTPIILVLTDGGFPVINAQWGIADMVLSSASPAEVEGRLRLVSERGAATPVVSTAGSLDTETQSDNGQLRCGDLVVDTNGYTASLHGRPIDLAYKEFELLKYLVQHPGRVFTRAQLLQEVWGYDYYGGTRTVDVHIRRLRAKLGGEYEHLIGTVRNVGYRFDPPEEGDHSPSVQDSSQQNGSAQRGSSSSRGTSGVSSSSGANVSGGSNGSSGTDSSNETSNFSGTRHSQLGGSQSGHTSSQGASRRSTPTRSNSARHTS